MSYQKMTQLNERDIIIAVEDGPPVGFNNSSHKVTDDKIYYKGDIMRVHRESIEDSSGLWVIIWHSKSNQEYYCKREHFELLSENRDKKLNQIINSDI